MTPSLPEINEMFTYFCRTASESPIRGRLDNVEYAIIDLTPEPSILVVRGNDQIDRFTAHVIADLATGKVIYEHVHGPHGELDRAAEAYPLAAQRAFDAWRDGVNEVSGAAGIRTLLARQNPELAPPESIEQKLAR